VDKGNLISVQERRSFIGNTGGLVDMSVAPEIAWLVPVVIPFIIGLLLGAVIKRVLKLLMFVVILVVILVLTGILSVTFSGLLSQAMLFLPKLYDAGRGIINVLPYSSLGFIIGLIIGFIFA
jgi:hypothetical protein